MISFHYHNFFGGIIDMKWYYEEYGKAIGPFDEKEIKKFIESKKIRKNTNVKNESMEEWKRAIETSLSEIFGDRTQIEKKREKYKWYYSKGGTAVGPFQESEIAKMIRNKELSEDIMVKEDQSETWHNIADTYLHYYFEDDNIGENETENV